MALTGVFDSQTSYQWDVCAAGAPVANIALDVRHAASIFITLNPDWRRGRDFIKYITG